MSSGKIEQNYFKNVECDLILNESVILSENIIHKSHFSESNSNKEKVYPYFDNSLKHNYGGIIDDDLNIIQKIHILLQNSKDLTQREKYEYCNRQRFYMKLYLKRISNKY